MLHTNVKCALCGRHNHLNQISTVAEPSRFEKSRWLRQQSSAYQIECDLELLMATQPVQLPVDPQETHLMLVRLLTVAELLIHPTPKRDDFQPDMDMQPSVPSQNSLQKSPDPQADV